MEVFPGDDEAAVQKIDLVIALQCSFEGLDRGAGGIGKDDGGYVVVASFAKAGGEGGITGDLFVFQAQLPCYRLSDSSDGMLPRIRLPLLTVAGGVDKTGLADTAFLVRGRIGAGDGVPG